jgi:hypothetical protein
VAWSGLAPGIPDPLQEDRFSRSSLIERSQSFLRLFSDRIAQHFYKFCYFLFKLSQVFCFTHIGCEELIKKWAATVPWTIDTEILSLVLASPGKLSVSG